MYMILLILAIGVLFAFQVMDYIKNGGKVKCLCVVL